MTIIGKNQRSYPGPHGYVDVLVVLVEGDANDYACYAAGSRDPDWTARHGDKLSFAEACIHFPGGQLVAERYRG